MPVMMSGVVPRSPEDKYKHVDRRVGDAFERLRVEHTPQLTQGELARAAGISLTQYGRATKGLSKWTFRSLLKVADALEVDPAVVLVLAGLSAPTLDVYSLIAQDERLAPRHRRLILDTIREVTNNP